MYVSVLHNKAKTRKVHYLINNPFHLYSRHSEAVISNLTQTALAKLQESSAALSQTYLRHKIYQNLKDGFGRPKASSTNRYYNNPNCLTQGHLSEYVVLTLHRVMNFTQMDSCARPYLMP